MASFCYGCCFAIEIKDIPEIRNTVLTNAFLLAISSVELIGKFDDVNISTNFSTIDIVIKNIDGNNLTNGCFRYDLDNQSSPYRIECTDTNTNSIDYAFFPNGNIRKYIQYRNGNLDGFYIEFYTNTLVNSFMNFSNNHFFGISCSFAEDGTLINAITSSVPVPLIFEIKPPQE